MSIPLKIRSSATRQYPQNGDEDYGVDGSAWAQDVTTAINLSPTLAQTAQYAFTMGTVAQVTSGIATHSNWATLLAAASDGDSVFVLSNTYQFTSTFDITKRLNIVNQGTDCYYTSAAALVAGGILKFSGAGTRFTGGTIEQVAGTPEYAIEIDAEDIFIDTQLAGVYSAGNILFSSGAATFSGFLRDGAAATTYGLAAVAGANTSLSNLANPTAVNQDLLPDVDNIVDCGSVAKRWKEVVGTDITATNDITAGNDISATGDIDGTDITATGTVQGNVITSTTSVTGATVVGNTSVTGGNVKLSANKVEATNATGGIDLETKTTGRPTTTVQAVQCALDYKYQIQDYTVVGTVGSANQQFAGRDYTLAELEAYFGAAKVISFYKFGAGAALGTDEKAAYNYTLGAAAKAPSNGTGIMGLANTAISFDGGDYATNTTKFDDMTTTFSGAGKGLIHSFWFSLPADGQPAAENFLFYKKNTAANDYYYISISTSGGVEFRLRGNGGTAIGLFASTILPNGINTNWYHCVLSWNTANGFSLYINGKLEGQVTTATTLMVDGTNTDFFIGAIDSTPTSPLTGLIANEVVVNDVCTQAMVDFLYATTIPLPAVLQGEDFVLRGRYKNLGVSTDVRQFTPEVVQIRSTDILLKPDIAWQATDSRRLVGEV